MPAWLEALVSGARGAGTPAKLTPPSVVRTIDVHGGVEQGAVPSSHQVSSLIAVNDAGANPAGTGPDGPVPVDAGFETPDGSWARARVPAPRPVARPLCPGAAVGRPPLPERSVPRAIATTATAATTASPSASAPARRRGGRPPGPGAPLSVSATSCAST